jgi:ABC-type multidrug transport system fused ATPase/permease subunit
VNVLRHTWVFLRPHRGLIALAALGIVGSTLVTVAGPFLFKYAIDSGIDEGDESAITIASVAYLALVLLRPVLERRARASGSSARYASLHTSTCSGSRCRSSRASARAYSSRA